MTSALQAWQLDLLKRFPGVIMGFLGDAVLLNSDKEGTQQFQDAKRKIEELGYEVKTI